MRTGNTKATSFKCMIFRNITIRKGWASTGDGYATAEWLALEPLNQWLTLSLNLTSPPETSGSYSPASVVELGVEIGTGSGTSGWGTAMLYFDTVEYS